MSRTHYWLVIVTALSVASCAHSPRVYEETPSVLAIRADYLASNPDGTYNDYIARGEVVPGMGFMDVLASWGIPSGRMRNNEEQTESWIYVGSDPNSQDWVRYTFYFEGRKLMEWETTRHVTKNGALVYWEPRPPRVVSPPAVSSSPRNLSSLKR